MNQPRFLAEPLAPPNEEAAALCRQRLDRLTKPPGSLGRLEELAIRLAAIRGFPPKIERSHVLVFAADHGVASEGVSAYPKAVTAQMVVNFLNGGAAINGLAKLIGAPVTVVDAGVDADLSGLSGLEHQKVRRGSRNLLHEDAMSRDEAQAAIEAGIVQATSAIAAGADVLCLGEMGIGNTTAAAALTSAILELDPEATVGRGTGVDDAGRARKVAVVRAALKRHAGNARQSPFGVLCALGGLEIAALCGAMFGAAARNVPVVVDGYIVSSAALCAVKMEPALLPYLIFAHRSVEPGHQHVLGALQARPLLELDLRLGEGTGAALAVPLLKAACAIVTQMATFDSAGVSNKIDVP